MTEVDQLVKITAEIVSAHVTQNTVAVSDLPALISGVYASLARLGGIVAPAPAEPQPPAVSVRASIKPDHLVCLEDGKQMKMLKRHLMTDHQLTPAAYRTKWKLPDDYPMVASNYAAERRTLALSFGLGNKRQGATEIADQVEPNIEAAVAAVPEPIAAEAPPAKAARVRKPRLKIAVE